MLATIISADHLLIYGKRSELINTRIVHFNQLLSVQGHISLPCAQSRRNGFATAMWEDWAFRTNWRGAQLFADAGSNLWSMAAGGYARNRRNGRAGSRKKNRPLAMQTTRFSRQITDVLIWPCICTKNPWELLFLILVRLILVDVTMTLASSLMVKASYRPLSRKHSFRFSPATSCDQRLCCISDAAIVG